MDWPIRWGCCFCVELAGSGKLIIVDIHQVVKYLLYPFQITEGGYTMSCISSSNYSEECFEKVANTAQLVFSKFLFNSVMQVLYWRSSMFRLNSFVFFCVFCREFASSFLVLMALQVPIRLLSSADRVSRLYILGVKLVVIGIPTDILIISVRQKCSLFIEFNEMQWWFHILHK